MADEVNARISRAFAEGWPIDRAVQRAARVAIVQHWLAGVPVVIWRDGAIAEVPAEALLEEIFAKKRTRSKRARPR